MGTVKKKFHSSIDVKNDMLKFRPTLVQDLDKVLSIERDPDNINWIFPYSKERHLQVLENSDEYHYIIEDESGIIGFIILAETEKEHNSIEFRRIAIQVKGKGYGRQTMRWVKQWAFNTKDAYRLWLDVFPENLRALNLYRSEGFKEEGMKRESIHSESGRRSQIIMSMLSHEYL